MFNLLQSQHPVWPQLLCPTRHDLDRLAQMRQQETRVDQVSWGTEERRFGDVANDEENRFKLTLGGRLDKLW
jgi:hypothetical protein